MAVAESVDIKSLHHLFVCPLIEDMPTRWLDVMTPSFLSGGFPLIAKMIKRKIHCDLRGKEWPVQDDHIRMSESEIQKWITGRLEIT